MKKKKQNRTLNLILNIFYVIFVAIIFIVLIQTLFKSFTGIYKPNKDLIVEYDLSKDLIPDPVQKSLNPPTYDYIRVNGVDVSLKELATYDITGKVEAIQEYSTNVISNFFLGGGKSKNVWDYMSPIDLTLSWGRIAQDANSRHFVADQSYLNYSRKVSVFSDAELVNKYGREYIMSHYSNNHIITLDENYRKLLSKVKVGDIVRIQGYLVYAITEEYGNWGPSSLTRSDTGDHACEILYLTDMVIMPKK